MKQYVAFFLLLASFPVAAQDPITAANKCYDEKNYDCAVGKYKEALADRKYQEKDYSEIKYRVGVGLNVLGRYSEAVTHLKDAVIAQPSPGKYQWELAWALLVLKEYQQSVDQFAGVVGKYQGDTANLKTIYAQQAKAMVGLKKYTDAIAALKKSLAIDSSTATQYASLGDAYYNAGLYAEALSAYRTAVGKGQSGKKGMAALYYWMGKSYANLKLPGDALYCYQKALEYDPTDGYAIWAIGSVQYDQKKYRESLEQFTKAMPYFKSDTANLSELYYWRGRSYSSNNEATRALAEYDAALKLVPDYRGAVWQKAVVYKNQKKYKEALPLYDKAIDMYVKNNPQDANLDDLYFYRGLCHFHLNDTVNAEKEFQKSLAANKGLVDPKIYLGHISYGRKKYWEAKNFYADGVVAFKTDSAEMAVIYLRKGHSNYLLGDNYLYTAREDLIKSVAYDSTNRQAQRYLADAWYRNSNFSMAESLLTKCIRLYKNDKDSLPLMYLYRGMARAQQKKYKDALADYEQSDKLSPLTHTENVKYMGQLAYEIKEFDKAGKIFTRVIKAYRPDQTNELLTAYFFRGCAAVEAKKKTEAISDLKKALELSPGNKDVLTWMTKAEAL